MKFKSALVKFCLFITIFGHFQNFEPASAAQVQKPQIFAGKDFACALLNSNDVRCWGANSDGQLGLGTRSWSGTPTQVPGLSDVKSLALGDYNACAVLNSGTVKCWGWINVGQGDAVYPPTEIAGLSNVLSIGVGTGHYCALFNSGEVKCWGRGDYGQRGDGCLWNCGGSGPVLVEGLTNVISIGTGEYHNCALLASRLVKCWGAYPAVGIGQAPSNPWGPDPGTRYATLVPGLSDVKSLSVGRGATCAILYSGEVKCWGYNFNGQLATGDTSEKYTPETIPSLSNSESISLGYDHGCARFATGLTKCWGYNYHGQVGFGFQNNTFYGSSSVPNSVKYVYSPTVVSNLGETSSLALGKTFSCAAMATGRVKCWGWRLTNSAVQYNSSWDASSITVPEEIPNLTLPTPPGPVGSLTVSAGAGSVLVNFATPSSDGGSEVLDFLIEYRESNSSSWTTYPHSQSPATLSYKIYGLTNGLAYDFRVSVINSVGVGDPSQIASATPQRVTPIITASPAPTKSPIRVGNTLSQIGLSGGGASVAGTFAYATPAATPAQGAQSVAVVFTPTDTTNYDSVTFDVPITVVAQEPTITSLSSTTPVRGQSITVNGTNLTGATFTVGGVAATVTTASATAPVITVPTSAPVAAGSVVATTTGGSASTAVTVTKETPTLVAPTATGINYGAALSTSTLSGGSASINGVTVAGSFAWTTPTAVPTAGTASYSVTFTPTDTTGFNNNTTTTSLVVGKTTPTINTTPAASAISYGQTLASSSLSGGVASVAGSFAFTAPTTAPATGTASYNVTFTPTDTSNYNTTNFNVSVTTNKATPSVTATPTAAGITYGAALSTATLSGGSASVPGTFAYVTPTAVPNAGTYSAAVRFTPTDTTNYNTVDFNINVSVAKVTPSITASPAPTKSPIRVGNTLSQIGLSGGGASVAGTFAYATPAATPAQGAQSVAVVFTPTDTTNYDSVTFDVPITVVAQEPTITSLSSTTPVRGQSITVNGTNLTGATFTVGGVAATVTTASGTDPVIMIPASAPIGIGLLVAHTSGGSASTSISIEKISPVVSSLPIASGITYGSEMVGSILHEGIATVDGEVVAGSFAWTTPTAVPTAGTASYSVTFTPTDTDSYSSSQTLVDLSVAKARPEILKNPVASDIEVGQPLASSYLSGGSGSVGGTWSWLNASAKPRRGTSEQIAVFTPNDSGNYESVQRAIWIKVNLLPAKPTIASIRSSDRSVAVTIAPALGGTARTIYEYEFTLDGGETYCKAELSGRTFTVPGLTNGGLVSVQVRAVNQDGASAWSNVKTAIPATTPDAPQITFIRAGMNSVIVHFIAPNTSGARIKSFQYSLDGGISWQAPIDPAQLSPIRIFGLSRRTEYQIKIRGINIKGAGAGSNELGVRTANCTMIQCTKFFLP